MDYGGNKRCGSGRYKRALFAASCQRFGEFRPGGNGTFLDRPMTERMHKRI
jgi:hypothetical protein